MDSLSKKPRPGRGCEWESKSLGVCEQVFLTLYPAIFFFFFPCGFVYVYGGRGLILRSFIVVALFGSVVGSVAQFIRNEIDTNPHKPTETVSGVPVGLPERSAGLEKAEEEGRHSQNKQSNTTAAPPQRCSSSALIYPHPPPHNLRLGTKVRHRVHRPTVVVNISWLPRPTSKRALGVFALSFIRLSNDNERLHPVCF